uniref:BAR domain-containing protein n=1 Tax=Haemonchus contortus TaxID=6289 RepID=A0A7I4Y9B4_HAECO|nr:unnamed protein product [Haemonchus contortus]
MPKLLTVAGDDDYPEDFVDTIERISVVCDCLDKLERLCGQLLKDRAAKQKKWAQAGKAFKLYGAEIMTPEVTEIFQKAADKFIEISTDYQQVRQEIDGEFRVPIHEFNQKEVKNLKENLKKLDTAKKLLNNSRNKLKRKPEDPELKIAVDVAKGVLTEQLKSAKEAVLEFQKATAFFQEAALAFISTEKEINEKAHRAITDIVYSNKSTD